MSRIGRMPVLVPGGVTADIAGDTVKVKGPKGELAVRLPAGVTAARKDATIVLTVTTGVRMPERELASRHGMARALVNNMVEGVTKGYQRVVELQGAGYRPAVQGAKLVLTVGYSHPVTVNLPEGIKAVATKLEVGGRGEERHTVTLTGCDNQQVGELAAHIRRIKPADAYKGKGIRYGGEVVRKKPGKAAAGAAGGTGGK